MHFLLVITVSSRETLWLVGRGLTILPLSIDRYSEKAEGVASAFLDQYFPASNLARQGVATYLHIAGIQTGYGYFAPNVPTSYKLVFELQYPDGHVEYDLAHVSTTAAELRVAGLLDEIGRTHHDVLREILIKMLAHSVWREHPDVTMIRAVFGSISLPSPREFERGKRESYEFLYAYDFTRTDKINEVKTP